MQLNLCMRALSLLACLMLIGPSCGGGATTAPPPGNGDDQPTFLDAQRYFPTDLGVRYIYRPVSVLPPLRSNLEPIEYLTMADPEGMGTYFEPQGIEDGGPVFNGLHLVWSLDQEPTARTDVLPPMVTAIGQSWLINASWENSEGHLFIIGSAQVAGLDDLTVQGTNYADCLRLDVEIGYDHVWGAFGQVFGTINFTMTGSYWLAPDVGAVRGIGRIGGVEVGRVELVERAPAQSIPSGASSA